MRPLPPLPASHRTALTIVCSLSALIAAAVLAFCGGSGNGSKGPQFSGNTQVTLVLSSTANDQLSNFAIGLTGIALTSQSGKTVNLFTAPAAGQTWGEFIHINGGIEPLVTATVPQDIYTAATVSIGDSYFSCVTLTPTGGLDTSTFAYGTNPANAPATTVTVNLSSPITITGSGMGLDLDLQVLQSATYSACYDPSGTYTYAITPTFNLLPLNFAIQPSNPANGKILDLKGQIASIGTTGNSFTLSLPEANIENTRTIPVSIGGSTAFQGISGFSALSTGTLLDMDAAIQPDGTILATRIAVEDASAVDVLTGPAMFVSPGQPAIEEPSATFFNRQSMGRDPIPTTWPYGLESSIFQVSGQFSNLQSLPFVASFQPSNLVAGQNVYVASATASINAGVDPPATSVTLMPQTLDGTVLASTPAGGGFTDYTITLAPYDLFPELAVQQGQTTLLSNPTEVEVYVDSSTQMLNTQSLAAGNTMRFYGLVFNDNGTLRMDCGQVNDGVPFNPPAAQSEHTPMISGQTTVTRRVTGRRQMMVKTLTQPR